MAAIYRKTADGFHRSDFMFLSLGTIIGSNYLLSRLSTSLKHPQ